MAEAVYLLCTAASILCAILLYVGYRGNRTNLLLYSSICFAGLALNNAITFLDLVIVPDTDLSAWRAAIALAAETILITGLIARLP